MITEYKVILKSPRNLTEFRGNNSNPGVNIFKKERKVNNPSDVNGTWIQKERMKTDIVMRFKLGHFREEGERMIQKQ